MKKEFSELCISKDATMLQAMEQMDRVGHKLLMVFENDNFVGLISILVYKGGFNLAMEGAFCDDIVSVFILFYSN